MIASSDNPASASFRIVRRNLGWLLASRGVLAVLSLVYLALAARALGVVGFGRFALITSAAQTLATLVAFQTWQVIVQFGVDPLERGDEQGLARLFRGSLLLDFGAAGVGVLLATAILHFFAEDLGIGPTLERATLIFTAVQILTVRSAKLGMLRLRGAFASAALADSMTPVVRLAGAAAVFLFHPTVQGFLFVWGLAELFTAAAYWLLIARQGDLRLLRIGRGVARLPAEHPGIVRFALATNATSTLGLSSKQLPLLLAGALVSPAAAGVFRLASQLAQGMGKLSQLLSRAAYPEMVKALAGAPPTVLRAMLSRLLLASSAGALAILTLTALLGRPVLLLLGGAGFAGAWRLLPWLALASSIDLAGTGMETILTALRRAGTTLAIRCAGGVAVAVAALALAPRLDGGGIAIAVAIGSFLATAGMAIAALHLARTSGDRLPR